MMKKKLVETKAMTAIMISLLLVIFNVVGLVSGQEVTSAPSPSPTSNGTKIDISSPVNELNRQLTAQSVVAGILLIITGFIYCFFGRRVYHITLFILGAYIGSFVAFVALLHAEPATGYTSDPSTNATIILLVSIAIGFIVGLLFVCCATVAIWLLGALAGYALAVFILSLVDGGVIKNEIGRIVFIVAFVGAGLVLTCLFEDTIIILGTAFIGADALILGIDVFAKTGFYLSVRAFLDKAPYTTSPQIYGMLAGLLGLFIVGSFVQFRYYRHRAFGPPRKGYNKSIGHEETPQQPGGEKKKSGYASL